jgi:hypothetical protein
MRAGRELCGKPTDDESKLESREVRPPTPTPERLKELGIDRFKLLVIRRIESKFYEHDGVELKPYEKDES